MAISAGDNLNSVALPNKLATAQNYLDFTAASATEGWNTISSRSYGKRSGGIWQQNSCRIPF